MIDNQFIKQLKSYAKGLTKGWNEESEQLHPRKVSAAGFPGGVVFYFETVTLAEAKEEVKGDFPDIYSALNSVENNAKLERVPSIKAEFDRVANEGAWNFDKTRIYHIEKGTLYFFKSKTSQFTEQAAKRDVEKYIDKMVERFYPQNNPKL